MYLTKTFLILLVLFLSSANLVYSQGCSDAGVCSFMIDDPNQKANDLEISYSANYGMGVNGVSIFSNQFDFNFKLTEDFTFGVTLPYVFTSGDLGSLRDFGDVSLLLQYHLPINDQIRIDFAGGFRMPTNLSELRNTDDLPMPMVYQTSLGTNDLLAAVMVHYEDWKFSTGFQLPTNRNKNDFDKGEFAFIDLTPESPTYYTDALEYQSSRELQRAGDVFLKVEKYFDLDDDFKISAGVLPILRLAESKVKTRTGGEEFTEETVEGTGGLTFNLIAGGIYKVGESQRLTLNLGFPLLNRKESADGLLRAFVAQLGYSVGLKF